MKAAAKPLLSRDPADLSRQGALVDSPASMNLERVIAALAPTDVVQRAPVEISDLAYDARAVMAGALFFCVRGERHDGHRFARDAIAQGAAALVVDHVLELDVPQLVVTDPRAAMATAAVAFFDDPSGELEVAGVTGTNGKTTVTFLLTSILDAAGRRPGLLGTVETRIGGERRPATRTTPEAIDVQRAFRAMLDAGDRSCALEATSHGSALRRLDGVRFSALAFTNLSQEHLDFHGTMANYFGAKRRLFVEGERPPAAVNVDDEHGRRLADDLRSLGHGPLVTFGFTPEADLRVEELELDPAGARFRAGGLELRTRLRGRFNVENVLAAAAVSRLLGVEDDAIAAGVEALSGVPGRFEAVDEGQPFAVVVDYSHKPDALANVLQAARELARNRLICVFGCGGDRDRGKRPLMGAIATDLADVAIVTSDNPRSEHPEAIIAEVLEGAGPGAEVEPDRALAIQRAIELAEEGDVVVIAGKGHEQGQEFADRTIPFDDRDVARDALRRLGATV
jgi:UDP-N-acetylmuramoyl-L-alanyl-D-glutamate--2,6-diaminopimelate ligase